MISLIASFGLASLPFWHLVFHGDLGTWAMVRKVVVVGAGGVATTFVALIQVTGHRGLAGDTAVSASIAPGQASGS